MADGRSRWYRFVQWFFQRVLLAWFGGIEYRGVDRVPLDGPVILAPNHFSYLDPPAVGAGFPRFVASMAREDLFKFPLGPLMRSISVFPVKRGAGDTEAIRHSLEMLSQGKALLIFPEGTRGMGQVLGPMSPGVAMLAKRTGALVLPTAICGTQIAMPRVGKGRRARMCVVYGKPFRYDEVVGDGNERERRERFAAELARRIVDAAAEGGLTLALPEAVTPPRDAPPAPENARTESGS